MPLQFENGSPPFVKSRSSKSNLDFACLCQEFTGIHCAPLNSPGMCAGVLKPDLPVDGGYMNSWSL